MIRHALKMCLTILGHYALKGQVIWKVEIYQQHTVDNVMVYIPKGNYLTSFVHGESKIH